MGRVNEKFDMFGTVEESSNRNAANGAARKTSCCVDGMMTFENLLSILCWSEHRGRLEARLDASVVPMAPSSGVVLMFRAASVLGLCIGAPSMYEEGGYVFHQ